MKAMVDLQWAVIQIASMAGGAGDFIRGADGGSVDEWLEDEGDDSGVTPGTSGGLSG